MMKNVIIPVVLVVAAVICGFQNNFAAAAAKADVGYKVESVMLDNEKCHIQGDFYNKGKTDANIKAVRIYGTLNDPQGNVLYTIDFTIDSSVGDLSQCIIPAKGTLPGTFDLTPDNGPITYDGEFTYKLTSEVLWN